ncbi:MAG: hypothetical protein E7137_02965 [Rikenellaceae bacterium]|nr:hypothetical protein [Rikenellaceae bacterium]
MRQIMMILSALLFLVAAEPLAAKNDSLKMARKAEKQREKEERKKLAEIERMAQPHFKGGDIDKFEAWVVANLKYDFGSLPRDTPHVRVEVPFYVEADGSTSLSDEEIPSERLYPRLVFEIKRVIQFSPEWEPGHDPLGNPIRTRQVLAITLQNHNYIGAPVAPRPIRRGRR